MPRPRSIAPQAERGQGHPGQLSRGTGPEEGFGSAEEFDRGECREERHGNGAHSDDHVAHGEVDLGFDRLDLVFEAGDL
jgi:hypothetical protein